MASAEEFLAVAEREIGTTEWPPDSNDTKYGEWYGMNGEPWCDMFVSWCGAQVGAGDQVGHFAYCPYHVDWFQEQGRWIDREDKPRPGDIVFFGRYGEAVHVGIVKTRNGSYSVTTIEGNTSTSSDDNGGAVMERERTYGSVGSSWYIMGFGRPEWGAGTMSNPQNAGEAVNDAGLWYRAHVEDYGWLGAVHDGQTAGTTGKGKRLEAFKISPPEGLVLEAKAHIEGTGWVSYPGIKAGERSGEGSSANDPIIGTIGKCKRLEALIINVQENTTGKELYYRVHNQDVGWTSWVLAGYATGSVGFCKRIEAIQMKLV